MDAGACIKVIVEVNRWIRDDVWREMGLAWATDKALSKMLVATFTNFHDLVSGAGPVQYGVMRGDDVWEWGILINTKNSQNVSVNPGEMLQDAKVRGLSKDWDQYADRPEILARRISVEALKSHEDVVSWFIAGLRELHDAKILDRFSERLTAKRAALGKRLKTS